ncbi:pentapeptide repeat-containing protein [Nocardia macrotermitis]|uniref:Pentapeptide repeat-containing protein n=1 Tax=Nocardia macrotermitis TaxID=2585198 RepID=A0A7K0CYI4_9NOCA|nr:pentapeptide repeat-containing protein [Nocardia macrotermitis]MQY18547.1 hypothetical protein [Nocardia macrotermitis]
MRSRWLRTITLLIVLGVGMVGVAWFTMVVLPGWVVGTDADHMTATARQSAKSAVQDNSIKLLGGLGTLLVAGFGIDRLFLDRDKQRIEQDKQRLDNDKHMTGQFNDATTHLAATEPNERANGVRTLFRLMVASPTDHMLVVAALCDMLRHCAIAGPPDRRRLPADLTAAVTALRDRPQRPESQPLDLIGVQLPGSDWRGAQLRGAHFAEPGRISELPGGKSAGGGVAAGLSGGNSVYGVGAVPSTGVYSPHRIGAARPGVGTAGLMGTNPVGDGGTATSAGTSPVEENNVATLSGADFTGADLSETHCTGVDFTRAVFRDANLSGADLADANLGAADLVGANATDAHFVNAQFADADLRGTTLRGAQLRRARLRGARFGTVPDAPDSVTDLTGANLDEAVLEGVDLRDVRGLTDAAIRTAIVDGNTKLPAGVRHPRLNAAE